MMKKIKDIEEKKKNLNTLEIKLLKKEESLIYQKKICTNLQKTVETKLE